MKNRKHSLHNRKRNVSKKISHTTIKRYFSFNSPKGYTYILLIILVFALLISLFASTIFYETGNPVTGILINPTPYGKHESLQVHNLDLITVTPTPTDNGSGDIPCGVQADIAFVPPGGNSGGSSGGNPGNGGSSGGSHNSNAPLPPTDTGDSHKGNNHNPGSGYEHQPDSKPCPSYTPFPTVGK